MPTITTTPFAVISPTTVTVSSGDTVYYYTDNTVGPAKNNGTIIAGANRQMLTPVWISSGSSSVVTFSPAPAVGAVVSAPLGGKSTLGTVVASIQAFDQNGNSLGFVPVYNTIT